MSEENKEVKEEVNSQVAVEELSSTKEHAQDKRPLKDVSENADEESGKKVKKHKRRRNYDDIDEKIAKEDKESSSSAKKDEDSESDIDDEKLDQLMYKEEEEEDDLSEIDTSNIITTGRRTRGKIIDYKKTAEELSKNTNGSKDGGEGDEDDEDDEDDEFQESAIVKSR